MSYEEHQQVSTAYENEAPNGLEFPTIHELSYVAQNLQMLAVVAFIRIWNEGGQDKGRAAKNDSKEIAAYREQMVASAFPDLAERAKFDKLLEVLTLARNQALAHTHAIRHDIKYQEQFVSYGGTVHVLNDIDVPLWQQHLGLLRKSVRELMIKLREAVESKP